MDVIGKNENQEYDVPPSDYEVLLDRIAALQQKDIYWIELK
jgi:hypothetical protein